MYIDKVTETKYTFVVVCFDIIASFIDLGQALENYRLTEGDEVAGARGAVLLHLDGAVNDLVLAQFESAVELELFIDL